MAFTESRRGVDRIESRIVCGKKLVETESFTLMKRLARNHKGFLNREACKCFLPLPKITEKKKINTECEEFNFILGGHLVKGFQLSKGCWPWGWFGNSSLKGL